MGILDSEWRKDEYARKVMVGPDHKPLPGRFLDLEHGQTYYELDNKEEDKGKPLLICIHGWSTASYVWTALKPELRKKGYRILSYDLYGRGYSGRKDVKHTTELFTHQLTQLLEKLKLNDQKLNIIGYSMGGAIAARFVSERLGNVERLLLIAPAGMAVQKPFPRFVARNTASVSDPIISEYLPCLLWQQFRRAARDFPNDENVQFVLQKQLAEMEYRGYIPALLSSLKGVLASKMRAEHKAIAASNVKVLAIFADQDSTIPHPDAQRRFDRWNRNRMSRVIKGAGHAVTYTHAQEIMTEAGNFL
ncbi:alpha/beta hydrolase [Ruegeria sp. SCPT10]|uniref:alpha/beta fold hydrolase n=1 Tax=Ruegeria sp. SCP10 TaxID=3141377 RepID=UPI00333C6BE2